MGKKSTAKKVKREKVTASPPPKKLTEEEVESLEPINQEKPKSLEESIAELKAPYYISKGNLDAVVDGMLGKVIGTQMQMAKTLKIYDQIIADFKKIVPKHKWPKAKVQN